jgi:hypothetical protein
MEKSKDNRLEQKEKLEAEIERSMSVVRMKQAHMQIEETEKIRKKPIIQSIIDRIDLNFDVSRSVYDSLADLYGRSPDIFKVRLPDDFVNKSGLVVIVKTFESIRFDLQTNIDLKNEDFDRLFPKLTLNFQTGSDYLTSLNCLNVQMLDMKHYCKRLL